MGLFFTFFIGILAIFPLYSNDSEENRIFKEPEPEITIHYNRDGGHWNTYLSGNVGHSYLGHNNFIVGLDFSMMYVPYGGMRYNIYSVGLDYQHQTKENESSSIFRLNSTYFRHLFYFGAGVGLSGFYNNTNKDTGIAPMFGGSLFLGRITIKYFYRYNLVFNNINYHETVLSLSINIFFNN